MSKGFASNLRIGLVAAVALAAFGGLGARLVRLHVTDRPRLLAALDKARKEIIPENACRGKILDAHGNVLATSLPLIVLGFDPTDLDTRAPSRSKWPELARLIGMPAAEMTALLTAPARSAEPAPAGPGGRPDGGFNLGGALRPAGERKDERPIQWVKIKEGIPESVYADVERLGVRGVYGLREYRRAYPHGQLAAHLLGFVNHDQQPVAGLERYLDFYLRGENGWIETEKDGRRQELAQFRSREVRPADGYDAVLSVDQAVQNIVDEELALIARKYAPLKATIIVSDPRTGFILGLGNYPSFDPNNYNQLSKAEQAWMNNVAVDAEYEPGSVFKIVAAAGALNERLVTPATTFDCTLTAIEYGGRVRKLPKEDQADHFDRTVPVSQIIARSSNRGAVQLAMQLGDERFYRYARAFGFGQLTGFPVGGEIRGALSSPKQWQSDATAMTHIPMGQGVAATALQMHQAMCVIASGGLLLRPQIIREIHAPTGETVFRYGPVVVRRVISEETAITMARLLWGVANSGHGALVGDAGGTAPLAGIPGYDVAGKTATANKILPDSHTYSLHDHVASFVGFLPAGDPQLAISVVIDDADARCPGRVAYGGTVAAPCFRDIAMKLISYYDIPPAERQFPGATLAALETPARGGAR
jgi:cell division protein FtsI/penicillin-binding protein 2